MADHRSFFFACKPGCDPVHLETLSAHARLPWVAQGYEVFEWRWLEDQRWVGMLKPEIDRLYAFCGVEPTDPYVISHAAQTIYDKAALLVAQMVAPDFYRTSSVSWSGDITMVQ